MGGLALRQVELGGLSDHRAIISLNSSTVANLKFKMQECNYETQEECSLKKHIRSTNIGWSPINQGGPSDCIFFEDIENAHIPLEP